MPSSFRPPHQTRRIEENLGITRAGDRSTQWVAHDTYRILKLHPGPSVDQRVKAASNGRHGRKWPAWGRDAGVNNGLPYAAQLRPTSRIRIAPRPTDRDRSSHAEASSEGKHFIAHKVPAN